MYKLWVVLKVSLIRPWVWLMMFLGAFQLFPLVIFTQSRLSNEQAPALPGFDRRITEAPLLQELQQLARDRKLASVEVFSTQDFPGFVTLKEDGNFYGEPDTQPRSVMVGNQRMLVGVEQDRWPVLDQLPQLKALFMQPPKCLGPEGWQRIGRLSQLEELTLAGVGAVHPETMKTASTDLEGAISKLTRLRQLDLRNTGGADWTLPPLPNLEYVVLSENSKLEDTFEGLAKHSPKLHTLALRISRSVFTDRVLAAMHQMPNLRQVYVSYLNIPQGQDETQQMVELLRNRLPGVAIYRADYSPGRVAICGSLLMLAGFLTFVAWFQAGLTLAQPLAAVIPGHRGPHLFWPVGASLFGILFATTGALFAGAKLSPALALACLFSTWMATVLQGYDIRPAWQRITKLVLTVDVLCLIVVIGLAAKSISQVDGFLMGDYPVLANLLMLWLMFGAGWKFVRGARLHRILAQSGMSGIPGLNLGMQHMYDQPFKPAPGWSLTSWQFQRMGNAIDHRIARMDRTNWISMLSAGAPTRLGLGFGLIVMGGVLLMLHLMTGFRPYRVIEQSRLQAVNGAQAVYQATLIILIANVQSWVGRRGSIAADFLRPVSREKFWSALRMAIFHDLKPCILFALVGSGLASYHANKAAIAPLGVLLTLISVIGCFAFIHAWVVRLVISKRLVIDVTLAMVTSMAIVTMAFASVEMEGNDRTSPWVVIMLSLGVLASGGWMQLDLARKLPDWELG